jgi:diguanylate cyclase (GGDEF)-like protein/PAS domain S-box-containing protein
MNSIRKLSEQAPDCIQAAQIGALLSIARAALFANLVVALLVVFFLREVVEVERLSGWLAGVVAVTLGRWVVLRRSRKAAGGVASAEAWRRAITWGALASGVIWGSSTLLVFPAHSLPHQLFVLCTLVGMMAGSAVSWSAYFPAVSAFFVPMTVFILMRLLLEAQSADAMHGLYLGLISTFLVFVLALYAFARNANRSFCALVRETERSISGERYKSLFDGAQIPMMLIDPQDGRIVDANTVACEFYGYSEDQLKEMSVLDLEAVADGEVFPYSGQEVRYHQLQQTTASGSVRRVEVYSGPVQMGELRVLFYVIHDITQRSEMEQQLKLGKLQLRTILDNMPLMAWLKDTEGHFLEVNTLHARSTGLGIPARVVGKTDADIWPKELAAKYRRDDLAVMESRNKLQAEEIGLEEGRLRWYNTVKVPILGGDGEVVGTAGYAQDITERKRTDESMRLAAAIYQSSSEAIMVTNEHNLIVEVNPAFTRITGYELDEVKGRNPRLLQSGKHDREFYQNFWHQVLSLGYWHGELWDRRKNGELYAKWVSITLIRRDDDSILYHVAQFSEITEKKKQDELVWQQANFDSLTGLPNRRLFRDRLEQEIKKANRSGGQLALLFIDLDRFKQVNDTLGHEMGDRLLAEAAKRISACVRETDTVARLGGDEFTVILPNFGEELQLERLSRKIVEQLNLPFNLGSEQAHISASIGTTLYAEGQHDADSLLRHADQAMYAAKAEGRRTESP